MAWHPLGWQAAWLTEIEPFPSALLAHRYPEVPNYGDMTDLPARIAAGEVEAPDVLCGGTPCQAFSIAGLRRSLDDARGNLSLIFCDIADEIDTIRAIRGDPPVIVLWENVPGVLNTKDNAFGCLLGQLAGEDGPLEPPGDRWTNAGCVFGPKRTVAWRILDAQYFGLAQRRRRVFVVASARLGFDPVSVLFESDGLRRDSAPSREPGQGVARDIAPCLVSSGRGVERTGHTRGQDPVVAVQPGRRAVGDAVGFQSSQSGIRVVDVHATLDANNGSRRHNGVVTMAHGHGGAEIGYDRGPTLTRNHEAPIVVLPFDTTQITSPGNVSSPKYGDACHPLAAGAHPPAIAFEPRYYLRDNKTGGRPANTVQLSATGAAKAGDAAPCVAYGFQPRIARNGRGDMGDLVSTLNAQSGETGKGDAAPCVAILPMHPPAVAMRESGQGFWMEDDKAGTLRAEGENRPSRPSHVIKQGVMQVRRLTPVECERLQGFPDNYTAIPWRKKPAADCPDGPRYKALGNSWAVPCVRWIGQRIDNACRAMPINSTNSTEDDEL